MVILLAMMLKPLADRRAAQGATRGEKDLAVRSEAGIDDCMTGQSARGIRYRREEYP